MALAFTGETSVKPSGHSAVLVAAARLHATVRGQAIRDMVLRLSEQYGAVVFQAQARMRFQNIRHTRVVAAYVRATAACKRALVNQWHVKTFAAQIRLQVPPPAFLHPHGVGPLPSPLFRAPPSRRSLGLELFVLAHLNVDVQPARINREAPGSSEPSEAISHPAAVDRILCTRAGTCSLPRSSSA